MQLQQSPEAMLKTCSWGVAMFERPSQRMSAAVGTNPSCIAQESPLLMCSLSLSLSLQTHLFQDSVSPRDLYSVRTAASLPPSAVLHTFQKWSQWVDLALRLWKSKRHFSCFWHEKDNVGHRTLLANFDHEQVPCVSGSQQTNASWSFFFGPNRFFCIFHVFAVVYCFALCFFCFLWFFNRLIFSSHRWGTMKISFP